MNAPSSRSAFRGHLAHCQRGRWTQSVVLALIVVVDLLALGVIVLEVRALLPLLARSSR